jgi:hypothetical protein
MPPGLPILMLSTITAGHVAKIPNPPFRTAELPAVIEDVRRLKPDVDPELAALVAAVECISAAMAVLAGSEILHVEWQVYAAASRILALAGSGPQNEEARAHAVRIAARVADILAGEPVLQQSLLRRVEGQLVSAASA